MNQQNTAKQNVWVRVELRKQTNKKVRQLQCWETFHDIILTKKKRGKIYHSPCVFCGGKLIGKEKAFKQNGGYLLMVRLQMI